MTDFAVLFCVAGVLKLASATFLSRQSDDGPSDSAQTAPTFPTTQKAIPKRAPATAKRLLAYLVLMQAFVQLSGPYFVPYMLQPLKFSYGQYACNLYRCTIGLDSARPLWMCAGTYHGLLAASSVGRLLCLSVLIGISLPKRTVHAMVLRILSVRPGAGSVSAPVVASQSDE